MTKHAILAIIMVSVGFYASMRSKIIYDGGDRDRGWRLLGLAYAALFAAAIIWFTRP